MSRPAFDALDRHWAVLIRSPAATQAVARWRQNPDLAAGGLEELVQRTWRAGRADADRLCAALAQLARTDEIAARTLLQILRPGLRALARRLSIVGRHRDVDGELLGLAWERIRTYPFDRRPRHIAANVLLDVRKRYIGAVSCRDSTHDSLELIPATKCGSSPSAEHQALEGSLPSLRRAHDHLLAAIDTGRITRDNASIVWRSRIQQDDDAHIARDLGLEIRTLQRRRQRTERRLAAVT